MIKKLNREQSNAVSRDVYIDTLTLISVLIVTGCIFVSLQLYSDNEKLKNDLCVQIDINESCLRDTENISSLVHCPPKAGTTNDVR